MISYEGLFFENKANDIIHSLESKQLTNTNDIIHCTFKYHPTESEIFDELLGKSFDIYLIAYANDGNNSGFKIQLPEELIEYYINYDEENPSQLKVPHITASLSSEATASNTKKLDFKPLKKPIKITGKFGFWIKENNKEYLSYEPRIKENNKDIRKL